MPVKLTDLRNFIEVANSATMREAAARLGITQPSLSESVKNLESDLGERLFYRSRSGVQLTPGGRVALQKANDVIHAISQFDSAESSLNRRLVTIGCHPVVASYCLPKTFKALFKTHPKLRVQLKHDLSRSIQSEIQQGHVDIGIVVNAVPSPDLVIKTVESDQVMVWKSAQLNGENTQRLFCDPALIQTQSILRKWKAKPQMEIHTDSLELLVRMVSEGLGYGIIPGRAVELLKAHRCVQVQDAPVYQDKISLVYRPEFGRNREERALIEELKRSFESI